MGMSSIVYSLRDNFLVALQGMLGDEFEHFPSLGSVSCGRISVGLCLTLLRVIIDVWELRKVRL